MEHIILVYPHKGVLIVNGIAGVDMQVMYSIYGGVLITTGIAIHLLLTC